MDGLAMQLNNSFNYYIAILMYTLSKSIFIFFNDIIEKIFKSDLPEFIYVLLGYLT